MARIQPAECLVPDEALPDRILAALVEREGMLISRRPPWNFARQECRRLLLAHFGTATLDGFDLDENSPGVTAAGALLQYVQETQKSALAHIVRLEQYRRGTHLLIDEATRRSLELTETLRHGTREGSLLEVLDETVTPMGARVLADRLSNPLTDAAAINARLDAVEEFAGDAVLCRDLREQLENAYDLERLTARVATGRAGPRDLGCLARTLALLPKLKAKIAARRSGRLVQLEQQLDLCADVRADVEKALADELPLRRRKGAFFRAATIRSWTNSADWRAGARSGLPNIRPRRSPARAFRI